MKCDFYTYNVIPKNQYTPVFKAKPAEPDWKSESGQAIIRTLDWLSTTAAAGIEYARNNKDKLDEETFELLDEINDADCDKKNILNAYVIAFDDNYRATKDEKIMDKHYQLLVDALKNKDLLRGGYSDLSEYELVSTLMDSNVIYTLGLLGKGNLESAFSLDLVGFENFCKNVSDCMRIISNTNLERLKMKINPENTIKYRNLEEGVKKDKRQINKLLGKENIEKRKILSAKIEDLKKDKSNFVQVKELKSQIQNLYKNCENSSEIADLMESINEKQREMKKIQNQKVNLSPQEIVNKIWTIASVAKSPYYMKNEIVLPIGYEDNVIEKLEKSYRREEDGKFYINNNEIAEMFGDDLDIYYLRNKKALNKDIKELIDLIQPYSEENDKLWKNNINKKLYERAGLIYNQKYADIINLANCKYLNELLVSDADFWNYMSPLLMAIAAYCMDVENPTVGDAIDDFVHNDITRQMFEARSINYDKWKNADKKSFISDMVTIKAEDARKKAVKNMCDELTGTNMKNLPKDVYKSFYENLNKIGVVVSKNHITINGKEVEFDDLDIIMSAIKKELNTNKFWSLEYPDEKTDKARDTIYCHFMLQRKQEIECAKHLKGSEKVDIKVQKVDMSDIKHSIGLGNDSHCCTALGSQSNEWSAPAYIMNRCIGAIEILAAGKPVGNTMMYIADVNGELSLVLDDIELQTKYQNNEKIKNMIIKYAKQVCTEINKPDIPIYAGPGMHKIDLSQFNLIKDSKMVILGKTPEDWGVYLDYDGEEHVIGNVEEKCDLYKIS